MPAVPPLLRRVKGGLSRAVRVAVARVRHRGEPAFLCPVCGYRGPFLDVAPVTGRRSFAQCPGCGALERHRLQWVVLERALAGRDPRALRVLHIAPEPCLRDRFRARFGRYETADLDMPGVDHHVDVTRLPFPDASYDLVYASHVLEHVRDDRAAIAELHRITAPGGLAILPVPLVAPATVEYPAPNPAESMHVRAPGPDYFDRYAERFARVDRHDSASVPAEIQPFVHEDRTGYPRADAPLRPPMPGDKHADIVPVCHR